MNPYHHDVVVQDHGQFSHCSALCSGPRTAQVQCHCRFQDHGQSKGALSVSLSMVLNCTAAYT